MDARRRERWLAGRARALRASRPIRPAGWRPCRTGSMRRSTWLGLHRVLEVLPASLALFAISILGNSLFIYSSDRMREERAARR